MKQLHSNEEYLKTIYLLEQRNKNVRVTDIAKERGLSKPSVNRALKILSSLGLLEYEVYGKINLTEKGRSQAEKILRTGLVLKSFLTKVLEVPEEIASQEAESMKYAISEQTVQKFEEYIESIIEIEDSLCCYNSKSKKCRDCERIKQIKKEGK